MVSLTEHLLWTRHYIRAGTWAITVDPFCMDSEVTLRRERSGALPEVIQKACIRERSEYQISLFPLTVRILNTPLPPPPHAKKSWSQRQRAKLTDYKSSEAYSITSEGRQAHVFHLYSTKKSPAHISWGRGWDPVLFLYSLHKGHSFVSRTE